MDQTDKPEEIREFLASSKPPIGKVIGNVFGLAAPPTRHTVTIKSSAITLTHLEVIYALRELTAPLPSEKALLLSLWLTPMTGHEQWKWGKFVNSEDYPPGSMNLVHLEEETQGLFTNPFASIQVHLPEMALRELASDDRVPEFSALLEKPWQTDPFVELLGQALLSALANGEGVESLLFDHLILALHSHLVARYSTAPRPDLKLRRLSMKQERLAKELLTADLTAEPCLMDIASNLDMPVSVFANAFKTTTGSPPFRWLRAYRVEAARRLLKDTTLSLAEISYSCGFSDQSHFTRVFTKSTGVTPGQWRKGS